jgi:hypothetical protein
MPRRSNSNPEKDPAPKRLAKGFVQTGGLLGQRIRQAGEKRGFAETRLLTQWPEVAGAAVAAVAQPVKVSYGAHGLGATLTLLTTGANAPMLQMQVPAIIERVNACYGYNAIRKIRITQTAPSGFSEGAPAFEPKPDDTPPPVSAERQQSIDTEVADVADPGLKKALSLLGNNVLRHPKKYKGN